MTAVKGVEGSEDRGCPKRVIRSLEPDATLTAGCRAMVIVTPLSAATYFDKVICSKIHHAHLHKLEKKVYIPEADLSPDSARKLVENRHCYVCKGEQNSHQRPQWIHRIFCRLQLEN